MDIRMYFGLVYGIVFDGRIPARQSLAQLRSSASHPTRHHTENTEITQKHGKYKESVGWNPCSTLPVPHTEYTEINGIHEKGDRGGLLRRSGLSRPSFRRKLVTAGSGNPSPCARRVPS